MFPGLLNHNMVLELLNQLIIHIIHLCLNKVTMVQDIMTDIIEEDMDIGDIYVIYICYLYIIL